MSRSPALSNRTPGYSPITPFSSSPPHRYQCSAQLQVFYTGNIRNIINKGNYPWRASRQVESLSWFLLTLHLAIKRIRTGRGEDSGRKNRSPAIPTLHWYWRLQLPGTLNDHPVAGVDKLVLPWSRPVSKWVPYYVVVNAIYGLMTTQSSKPPFISSTRRALIIRSQNNYSSLMVEHQHRRIASSKAFVNFLVCPTNKVIRIRSSFRNRHRNGRSLPPRPLHPTCHHKSLTGHST